MKLSIVITDEIDERPGDLYSSKKEIVVVDVDHMTATPEIIAATLRGAADKVHRMPSQIIYTNGINSNNINTNTISSAII